MKFTTEAHEAGYRRIAEWMSQLYGQLPVPRADDVPGWTVELGRRRVHVDVQSMGERHVALSLYSWPVGDARLPQAAYRSLLEINARYRFGSLNLQPNGAVCFECQLIADEGLTRERLQDVIVWMGEDGADIGAELIEKFPRV